MFTKYCIFLQNSFDSEESVETTSEKEIHNHSEVTAQTESSAFEEYSPNGLVAPLTKRPVEATTSSKLQKRKKKENEED